MEQLSEVAQISTSAAVGFAAISQIIMNGCLAQIWSTINGLQLIMHLSTMNLSIPAVAFIIIEKLFDIFTFDFPYINMDLFGESFEPPGDVEIFHDVRGKTGKVLRQNFE